MLLSLTQENAVDLHSMGQVALTLATTVGGRYIDRVQNMSMCHGMTFLFVYNKPKVKFMHSPNHIVHYKSYFITSYAKNTTAIDPNVGLFLSGLHYLLGTGKGR
jgi:hypothetical protein